MIRRLWNRLRGRPTRLTLSPHSLVIGTIGDSIALVFETDDKHLVIMLPRGTAVRVAGSIVDAAEALGEKEPPETLQ